MLLRFHPFPENREVQELAQIHEQLRELVNARYVTDIHVPCLIIEI